MDMKKIIFGLILLMLAFIALGLIMSAMLVFLVIVLAVVYHIMFKEASK